MALSVWAFASSVDAHTASGQDSRAVAPGYEALNSLPACDAVMVINSHRILTEALPSIMPAKSLSEMESVFDGMKLMSGMDVRQIDSIAFGMRTPKSISARMLPDVSIVVHGHFASDKVISALQNLAPAKPREQTYRDSKIYVFELNKILDPPATSTLNAPSEISLVALDGNTLAIGTMANVQRAIEAREGSGQISPALVALATRNPQALVTLAAIELKSKDPDIISTKMQTSDEIIQILSSITHLYAAIEMSGKDFQLLMFARTANPKQTIPLRDVTISLLHQLAKMVKDARAKSLLDNLQIKMHSNEVHVTTRIPQDTIASVIEEMRSTPPPPSPQVGVQKSQPGKRRRPRRRSR